MSKRCSKCCKVKPVTAFTKDPLQLSGLRPECKACRRIYNQKFYMKNRSQVKARATAWHIANPGVTVARVRRWRKEHPERAAAAMKENTRRWRHEHPDQARAQNHRRRALKAAAYVEHISCRVIYARDCGRCYLCGAPVAFSAMHLEHKTPLSRGGLHEYANVGLACGTCNVRKNTKTETEFRACLGGA